MQLTLAVLAAVLSYAGGLELPFVHAENAADGAKAPAQWWAQVGDRVYYTPPASFLGLSQNISDYYYAAGSKSALTSGMKQHVVGSQGRWHIFHLPKGPSMLQLESRSLSGDRRSAISAFNKLTSGMVLSADGAGFPDYELSSDYMHPLDAQGQELEKAAVSSVSPEMSMNYLKKLVTDFPTRSYSNATESDKVEHFLKKEFEAMGLHTCLHNFNSGGTFTNVVAQIPGKQRGGSMTVGAHYDSRPFQGKAPGAEDNGSGVAALLTIAKAYAKLKVVPKNDVYFVAFAGEEPGLIGSREFANALRSQGLPSECDPAGAAHASSLLQQRRTKRQTRGARRAIIMDEIGWASPKLGTHTVNLESTTAAGKFIMDNLRHSTELHNGKLLNVVHNENPFGSDHMSWIDHGDEAALTINGDDEAYPWYHQSTDTIDHVNGDLMHKVIKMNLGGLIRMTL